MTFDIRNNEQKSQYETTVDGYVAFAAYDLDGQRITFTHTEVPDALGGRGIAGAIAKFALDDARARNLTVVAKCPFISRWLEKHPEYEDLLAK